MRQRVLRQRGQNRSNLTEAAGFSPLRHLDGDAKAPLPAKVHTSPGRRSSSAVGPSCGDSPHHGVLHWVVMNYWSARPESRFDCRALLTEVQNPMTCPTLVVRSEETTRVGAGLRRKQIIRNHKVPSINNCNRAGALSAFFLSTEKPSLSTTSS